MYCVPKKSIFPVDFKILSNMTKNFIHYRMWLKEFLNYNCNFSKLAGYFTTKFCTTILNKWLHYYCAFYEITLIYIEMAGYEIQSRDIISQCYNWRLAKIVVYISGVAISTQISRLSEKNSVLMHTTTINNRGKFRSEILIRFWEIAVFVGVSFFSRTLYITQGILSQSISLKIIRL